MKILRSGQYFGIEKKNIQQPGYLLSEYKYLAERIDWHYHEHPYLMYVLGGQLLDINKQRTTPCTTGSLIFHNWQEPHYNSRHSDNCGGFHIELDRDWLKQHELDVNLWEGSNAFFDPKLHRLIHLVHQEFHRQDEFSNLAIEDLLLQICLTLSRNVSPEPEGIPDWVDQIQELIREQNDTISLQSLAQTLGVHPVHLSRAFPKYFHFTLGQYIRQQKVERALSLVEQTNYSLTEIAYACGFSDQSHFIRCFKTFYHMTPGAYRALLKQA